MTYTATLELIHPTYPTDEEWLISGSLQEVMIRVKQRINDMFEIHQEGIIRIYDSEDYDIEHCIDEYTIRCQMTLERR